MLFTGELAVCPSNKRICTESSVCQTKLTVNLGACIQRLTDAPQMEGESRALERYEDITHDSFVT